MQFEVPKPDWLPLSKALLHFHYSPHWEDATPEELLGSILFRLCEQFPLVDAKLEDGVVHVFRSHQSNGRRWTQPAGSFTLETGFKADAWSSEILDDEFMSQITAVLDSFVRQTERAFRRQHAVGRCIVFARLGSPLEPTLTVIPPDVFANFEIADWTTGAATAATNDKLFSIHAAAPAAEDAAAPGRPLASNIPAKQGPDYKHTQFAKWARQNNFSRGSGTLDTIARRYRKETGNTIDEKTMRKGFRLLDDEQGI